MKLLTNGWIDYVMQVILFDMKKTIYISSSSQRKGFPSPAPVTITSALELWRAEATATGGGEGKESILVVMLQNAALQKAFPF